MDSLSRLLLLPVCDIFSDCKRDAELWEVAAPHDGPESSSTECADDWKLFVSHCEALLKAGGIEPCPRSVDRVAVQLARVTHNCYRAALRHSAMRAEKARVAKRHKADERGRIVQQAIIAVCAQQKLTPTASEKFAASIHAEVIEAARQFGLADAKSGTSPRSLQRHIGAILKSMRLP